MDWIGLCSVLRPRQHSVGYMGDGFYRSKDPTNSIKVLKEQIVHRQIKQAKHDGTVSLNKKPQLSITTRTMCPKCHTVYLRTVRVSRA